jgi:hypothetical protein
MSVPLSIRGSLMWRTVVLIATLALVAGALAPLVAARSRGVDKQTTQRVEKVGTTRIHGAPIRMAQDEDHEDGPLAGEIRPDPEEAAEDGERQKFIRNPVSTARVPSSHVPRPATQDVVDASGGTAFDGLSHFDNRFAGTGDYENTQFSLEPPDQALCVGNGFVLESVNTVIRVRSTAGANLTDAMPLNDFFNLAPEIVRSADPLEFGPFTSDPKCYYDVDTNRWFVTLLELATDVDTGDFTGDSSLLIAVSTSSDPRGTFNLFSVDTTNDGTDGTPTHDSCPCLGDQPLIGADANGFFVTTNEFPVFDAGFNGANVYAFSKTALASGSIGTVVAFNEPTLAEGQAYSIQPATTPPGAAYATENGGTEYFLSALEFTGGLDNRIALWALSNTSSLSGSPDVHMSLKVLHSEVYGAPPTMLQKSGPTPLKTLIKSKLAPAALGVPSTSEHLNLLNSNDDRMNQTVYVDGQIWGALNTVLKSPTGATRTGIAWFGVTPDSSGTLDGEVTAQGYVAVQNNNVVFPAVAADQQGNVLVGYSLVGPDFYPSAAYSWIGADGTGDVNVAKWGVGPADGFTGYVSLDPGDGGVERWGDYSAAVADEAGNIWFATETINQRCTFSEFLADTTCGGTRSALANWGTSIASVTP